ncbi:hypothetical protein DTX79_09620 [Bacilli bacterium]|nr:hypothetical protein DTX79_09620 [Bacilli bacterium]
MACKGSVSPEMIMWVGPNSFSFLKRVFGKSKAIIFIAPTAFAAIIGKIGRRSCRERGEMLGGGGTLKKKKIV